MLYLNVSFRAVVDKFMDVLNREFLGCVILTSFVGIRIWLPCRSTIILGMQQQVPLIPMQKLNVVCVRAR